MYRLLSAILLMALVLPAPALAAGQESRALSFIASYQGLLSAGLPLDIAAVRLALAPAASGDQRPANRVTLEVSTAPFHSAELLYPVRFCYRSRLDPQRTATLGAGWWSHVGTKEAWGHLGFDRSAEVARRYQTERKIGKVHQGDPPLDGLGRSTRVDSRLDQERTQSRFPADALPLDQLGMLVWLREQDLRPGLVLQPAVTNGRQLTGYRIRVEGREPVKWNGAPRPAWRIRLEPRVNDGSDTSPSWLWLSRDTERLPLLLRTRRAFGNFEMRLQPGPVDVDLRCDARLDRTAEIGG